MIDREKLTAVIEEGMQGTDLFLVDITISRDNNIVVEIDSDTRVDIDQCVELSRRVESRFNRDEEDYELEIGSAGLTSPLRVERQYRKNIGGEVEVLTIDGRKLRGTLTAADSEGFVVEVTSRVKAPGAKRPVEQTDEIRFNYNEIKYTKYIIQF